MRDTLWLTRKKIGSRKLSDSRRGKVRLQAVIKPKGTNRRTSKPTTANKLRTPADYLAAVSREKRTALEKLRKNIKAAAPGAEECISYGLPAFRLNGKLLVAYGAAAKHCAFYPGSVVQAFKEELKDYDVTKGTIRFPADKPLPAGLVRKLVKARMAKNSRSSLTADL